jgi:hypothetical protein
MKKLCVLLFPMLLALAYGQVPAPASENTTRYAFILSDSTLLICGTQKMLRA